jgi:hypothetical protein
MEDNTEINLLDNSYRPAVACESCRTIVPGGSDGCRKLFEELILQGYNDPAFWDVQHFVVNAYSLQHPEGQSAKSIIFFLTGLCWTLERGGDPSIDLFPRSFSARFDGQASYPTLPPPLERGQLTILDVYQARPEESVAKIRLWAQSVWEAWSAYHDLVRQWVNDDFPIRE